MNTTIKLLIYATSVLMKVSESKLYNVVAANEAKLYTSKIMPTNNTESVRVFKRSICRYTFIRPVEIINYYNKICYYVAYASK